MDGMDRYRGCLLGLACGDAVGTAVEFKQRGSFEPVTDMTGGGPFGLRAGQWTDDTSMALCLATSLLEKGGHDPRDQMNRYVRWWKEGYLSSTGACFDIGNTVRASLVRFQKTGNAIAGSTDPQSAGNGSIMRLAPVPMFFASDPARAERIAAESSITTHGAATCVDACRFLSRVLVAALCGASKERCLFGIETESAFVASIQDIALGLYRQKSEGQILGTGYVVASLEAAIWSFWKSDSFESAILRAVNLGDDADTTAAICGQIAGAFYGVSAIPPSWLEKLHTRADISTLADRLYQAG